jgi:ribosomal protein S18
MDHALSPYVTQGFNKRTNPDVLIVRNKLFNKGREIQGLLCMTLQKYRLDKSEENRANLIQSVGEMSAYISIREAIAPNVATDQALNNQRRIVNRIKHGLSSGELR